MRWILGWIHGRNALRDNEMDSWKGVSRDGVMNEEEG